MKTLAIERSVLSFSECHDGAWSGKLDLDGVERIIVGTGPGSFAGVRSAIAFAQGYALGRKCEVLGIPSAAALAEPGVSKAVVGDARQGKFWLALFDGFRLITPVFLADGDEVERRVSRNMIVVSPDHYRIGNRLGELFGSRYLGEALPTAEGLVRAGEANPDLLSPDPLPIYLNPAVRASVADKSVFPKQPNPVTIPERSNK